MANAAFTTTAIAGLFVAADPAQAPVQEKRQAARSERDVNQPWTLRRWEAGETSRLNKAHWSKATGQPINADLVGNLRTLRARCCYEAANNPLVEGLLFTHATDLVGAAGPGLQVQSDSDEYNDALEQLWREWWANCDVNGELAGADALRQAVYLWWTKGEHLWQITSLPMSQVGTSELSLRLQFLDPDRLDTDPRSAGDSRVALGVRRNATGRPTAYQISRPYEFGPFVALGTEFDEYPADQIIHQYEVLEPGQVRGVPWLASGLQVIADLRDLDVQVLDAARLAASMGVVWYTDHDDATYWEVAESTSVERNKQWTGPPGWKPQLIDPKQPSVQYVQFRMERLRELGRGRAIPLMKILLGSERHNFASARMDNQNYQMANGVIQSFTERRTLNPLVNAVAREGALLRSRRGVAVLPPRPDRVQLIWTWAKQPHVDPVKEATAERLRLENGTLPFRDACLASGLDEEQVIASRARTARLLEAARLPPVPTAATVPPDEPDPDSADEPAAARSAVIDPDGFDDLDNDDDFDTTDLG